jgi:4-oxalocrotonate tautomerase family enzyme
MGTNTKSRDKTEKYVIIYKDERKKKQGQPALSVIQITLSRGRTAEQKRELVQVFTNESARILKTKKENIRILIYEVDPENWADAGVLGLDMKNR